jgi:hypothetical protein
MDLVLETRICECQLLLQAYALEYELNQPLGNTDRSTRRSISKLGAIFSARFCL